MSTVLLRPPHMTLEVPRNTDAVIQITVTHPTTGLPEDLTGDTLTWTARASRTAASPVFTVTATGMAADGTATFELSRTTHLLVSDLVKDVQYLFEITRLHAGDLTQIAVGTMVLTERFA